MKNTPFFRFLTWSLPKFILSISVECTYLRNNAKDSLHGFYCLNVDQQNHTPPDGCAQLCEANGQKDIETNDEWKRVPNCRRCANFKVRYFCMFEDYDCVPSKRDQEVSENVKERRFNPKSKSHGEVGYPEHITGAKLLDLFLQKKSLPRSNHLLQDLLNAATRAVKRQRRRLVATDEN